MTVRRDLTAEQIESLERYAAEGKTKSKAAKLLGVGHGWIDKSAWRLGITDKIDALFPRDHVHSKAFRVTEEILTRLTDYARAGITKKEACRRLGVNAMTLDKGAIRAGNLHQIKDLFPENAIKARRKQAEKESRKPEGPEEPELLPRDVCPQVKWLTKEWRVAA